MPPGLMLYFARDRWPGNIRELENIMERITVLARGNEISVADVPPRIAAVGSSPSAMPLDLPYAGISLENVEKELILMALERCDWNQAHAAKYLDISRKTLIYRMEKHGLARTIEG